MLEEELVSYLASDSLVTAQIGTSAIRSDKTNGIFPSVAPDEVPPPFLVYQKIIGMPMATSFEGTNALSAAHYKFAAYGSTYAQAKLLAKAVHDALLNYPVHTVLSPSYNVEIDEVWCDDDGQDNAEPMEHGTLYSTHLTFHFNYVDFSTT